MKDLNDFPKPKPFRLIRERCARCGKSRVQRSFQDVGLFQMWCTHCAARTPHTITHFSPTAPAHA